MAFVRMLRSAILAASASLVARRTTRGVLDVPEGLAPPHRVAAPVEIREGSQLLPSEIQVAVHEVRQVPPHGDRRVGRAPWTGRRFFRRPGMKRKRVQAFTAKRAPERAATAAARRSVGGARRRSPPKNGAKMKTLPSICPNQNQLLSLTWRALALARCASRRAPGRARGGRGCRVRARGTRSPRPCRRLLRARAAGARGAPTRRCVRAEGR